MKACRSLIRVYSAVVSCLVMDVDAERLIVRRDARGCRVRTDGNRRMEAGSAFRPHCVRSLLSRQIFSHQKREMFPIIAGQIRILLAPTVFLRQEELRYHDTAQMGFWRHHELAHALARELRRLIKLSCHMAPTLTVETNSALDGRLVVGKMRTSSRTRNKHSS
jgi:hypothetical protein